ncbi:MAG: DNA polymerase III subunit delta [Clostridiales bacterium]|nr:DNA polymerase III subunit delta [Clostridiales bacterium]
MRFIDLNKNLKTNIEKVYNITGDDFFLVKQAITNLKTFLIKEFEELNFVKLDADKMKSAEANELISTLPFGNDYRLIVLENPSSEVVEFINQYDFTDSTTVLVCINAENITVGEIIDCTKLDKLDISKYVLNHLKKYDLSIQEQALDYLIDATNANMTKIVNELSKLTAYCIDEDIITIDIVTNLLSNTNEYAIYTLTNAIDNKDYTSYQKILNEMSKSQTVGEIFSYLGKHFRRMQYIALNKDDNELAKILNIKPYAIKKSRQHIQTNGVKFYINLYELYTNLDYQIKSGKITAQNALYELIF